jgi:hypothetical protein
MKDMFDKEPLTCPSDQWRTTLRRVFLKKEVYGLINDYQRPEERFSFRSSNQYNLTTAIF